MLATVSVPCTWEMSKVSMRRGRSFLHSCGISLFITTKTSLLLGSGVNFASFAQKQPKSRVQTGTFCSS